MKIVTLSDYVAYRSPLITWQNCIFTRLPGKVYAGLQLSEL